MAAAGHFARRCPVPGHLVWADVRRVPSPLAGPVFGGFACASLPARCGRIELVGAFARADQVLEHSPPPMPQHFVPEHPEHPVPGLAQFVPGHLERAARARRVPAPLARPPKPGIASGFQMATCRPVLMRQFRRGSVRPLWSAARPEHRCQTELMPAHRRQIELLASTGTTNCRRAKPTPMQGKPLDLPLPEPRYRSPWLLQSGYSP